ncbi:sulfite oxidase heme-binding subunit YedZ [Gayadomonas joobiniege]|uniref:sulfite oxidase heme-binding subunit YedZ n=1 Tax=Gayadomonas joobiniege TaxID=1234606 RepID=UPI000365C8A2|nr:protein-methionine-sulfoxide reductase heme-binding subunit MsrQ [Gayadomonas joobiniege]
MNIVVVKTLIHSVCLAWLGIEYYQAITDSGIADPVEQVIHFTGKGALNLVIFTLMLTPLARFFKTNKPILVRRLMGLYAFFYAALHLLSFFAFELAFNFNLLMQELVERPYIWVGAGAFIILFALAVTSFHKAKKLLKKRWQSVHNLIYLGVLLAWLHFFWSRKADLLEPGMYLAVILLLLALRWKKIARIFTLKNTK